MFQPSLLSEGTEGYGDARSRALYSQVMLKTYGTRDSYGEGEGLSPEAVTQIAKVGTQAASGLFTLLSSGAQKKKAAKEAEAAALEQERLARAEAKRLEAQAKVDEAAAAGRTKMYLIGGGVVVALGMIVAGVVIMNRKKAGQ